MTPSQAAIHRRKTELGPMFWHVLMNGPDARQSMVNALQSPEAVPQLVAKHLPACFARNKDQWSRVGLFLQQMLPVDERQTICNIIGDSAPDFGVKREQPRQQQRSRPQGNTAGAGQQQRKSGGQQKSARQAAMDEAMDAMRAARERMGWTEHPFSKKAKASEGFKPWRPGKAKDAAKAKPKGPAPKPIWDKDFLSESNVDPSWTGSKKLQQMDQALGVALAKRVAADPDMQAAKDNWARMNTTERLAILDKLLGWHAELAGYPKPPLEAVEIAPYKDPKTGEKMVICGQACVDKDAAKRAVMMNTHPDSYIDKLPIVLMSVVHEATHIMQAHWGDQLRDGQVYSNDPLYKDHITFFKGVNGSYEDGRIDHSSYKAQPVEIHANRVQDSFVKHYVKLSYNVDLNMDEVNNPKRPKFRQF